MGKFVLSTDSCVDLFKDTLVERGIECLPMSYCIDAPVYDDFNSDADYIAFYDKIKAGAFSTTSQSNFKEAEEYFIKLLEKYPNKDIVHIALSSGLSSTCDTVRLSAEKINETLSGCKIYVIDSLSATQGQRLLVDNAWKMRKDGVSAADAVDKTVEIRDRLSHWLHVSDLKYLHKGGRLSKAAAVFGSMLKVKPIITINSKGKLAVVGKALGENKANRYILDAIKKHNCDFNYGIYIAHSDPEKVKSLEELLKNEYPDVTPTVGWVGPVIGSHTGPGLAAYVFVGDLRCTKK